MHLDGPGDLAHCPECCPEPSVSRQPIHREAAVHQELACGVEVPDVVGAGEATERGAIEDHGARIGPGAVGDGKGVARIAGDQELMALFRGREDIGATRTPESGRSVAAVEPVEARQIVHISGQEGEGVVAGAGEIEGLDGGEA